MSADWLMRACIGGGPPSFLPADLDTADFIEVTCVGDSFARFLDPSTGQVHDGAEYAKQAQREAATG